MDPRWRSRALVGVSLGAVVVAVGMDALRRVQGQSRRAALVFAAVAILLASVGGVPKAQPVA